MGGNLSTTAEVIFIGPEQMRPIIESSPFFTRMSRLDLIARKAPNARAYKMRYAAAIGEFTEEEKKRVSMALAAGPRYVTYNGMSIDLGRVARVAKLADGTENDWPHTLGNTICITSEALKAKTLPSIMLHERVHVWQRANPGAMRALLQGYIRVHRPARAINNPDIDDYAYMQAGVVAILSYRNDNPSGMGDSHHTNGSDHPYEVMATRIGARLSGT